MNGTASNYYVSKYYHLAVRYGLHADALLQQAGIDSDIIDVPGRRVDAEKLAEVLFAMWELLQDEATGLSSSPIPRGSFYMAGKLTVHEPNLAKALDQIKRFYGMVTRAFTMNVQVDGDQAILTCEMHSPEMDEDHLFTEMNLMAWHRYSSWLIAENIPINKAYFSYRAPKHVREYMYLFPGEHVFNAPYMGFSFHKKYLQYECVQSVTSLKSYMQSCPVSLFLQPTTDFSLSGELRILLNKRIKHGFPSIDEAAEHLNLTKRTLDRRLKDEGTSYQKIKDAVRRDKAINHLVQHNLSVSAVATKVGFSDSAVFSRAFRKWTGMSPKEYREQYIKNAMPDKF